MSEYTPEEARAIVEFHRHAARVRAERSEKDPICNVCHDAGQIEGARCPACRGRAPRYDRETIQLTQDQFEAEGEYVEGSLAECLVDDGGGIVEDGKPIYSEPSRYIVIGEEVIDEYVERRIGGAWPTPEGALEGYDWNAGPPCYLIDCFARPDVAVEIIKLVPERTFQIEHGVLTPID